MAQPTTDCTALHDLYIDHRNAKGSLEPKLFRAESAARKQERDVAKFEEAVRSARAEKVQAGLVIRAEQKQREAQSNLRRAQDALEGLIMRTTRDQMRRAGCSNAP